MSDPKPITEEQGVHKEWYVDAKGMTLDSLPAFLTKLTTEYKHDYGTICHAIAAAALAAAHAVDRSPTGGITGFQAGAIMWEFARGWLSMGDGAMRLVQYDDMLYPQYEEQFTGRTISAAIWERLQKKAAEELAGAHKHVDAGVLAHWKSIAAGVVPFGYSVSAE